MTITVWQAKLEGEDEEKATDKILDQMCDELNDFWEDLKDKYLKNGGELSPQPKP